MNNFYLKSVCFFVSAFLIVNIVSAQPGCPAVDAGSNVTLPCGTNCANLTANFFQTGNTTSYGVASIPYSPPFPFTGGTQLFIQDDDIFSDVINLPFTFCFYGNSYNQVVIGANGLISFDVAEALQYCEWSYTAPIPTPGPPPTGIYNNSINGAYHDIDPSVSDIIFFPPSIVYPANINYAVLGTAPCRTFVVNFSTVPHFDCNSLRTTQQIVIYETTNVIEVYIKDKPTCTTWNDGNAVIGLQNADGTQGITPPGRNTGPWSASNEAWRFTPNGASIVTVEWLQGGSVIGTGAAINVCPSQTTTTYTARATYLPCAGGTPVVVTDNVNVTLAGALQAGIDSSHNVSCFGANDGRAYAHATTTNAALSYGWANGPNTLTYSNLAPGTYVFTATDASGCVRSDTTVITAPSQLTANVPSVSQTNCSGTGTGTLLAGHTGGTGPFTFVWNSSPVQNDSILNGVVAGTYRVTVTDNGGCTATASGTLTVTAGGNTVVLGNPTITNVACFGGNTGSITANVSGGSGAYNYSWGASATNANLIAGTYPLTVDDGAGCTASATYNVTQPTLLALNAPAINNIGCVAGTTGSITANPTGGTIPYVYNWSAQNGGQTYAGQSISGLAADSYRLTVTDSKGCSVTATYTITSVPALAFTQSQTNVTCFGGTNGTATITVSSGTAPYAYNWNGAGPTANATLSNVSAGTVNVTVTDANCSGTATFNITQPAQMSVALVSQTNVLCAGNSTGAVTVAASGGAGAPYNYAWNSTPPQNSASATGLPAGFYTVVAADVNLCTATASYLITEPAALVIDSAQVQNVTCSGTPGSITVFVSGGVTAYTYSWVKQSTGQTLSGQSITGLQADTYNLTVTDNNSCSVTATYTVTVPAALTFTQSQTNISCFGGNNGSATVTVTSGNPPYAYNWNSTTAGTANSINALTAGVQNVTITDLACSATATFNLTQPAQIVITDLSQTNISCNGGSNGAIAVSVAGGTGAYVYAWNSSPAQASATATNLPVGPVTLVVTDANLCTVTKTYTITEPALLTLALSPTNATCYQAPNGNIVASPNGGTSPYGYQWSDPDFQTTKTATGLLAGSYSCVVTDANGCTVTDASVIAEPADLQINTSVTAVKCIGDKNGTITVDATGGTQPYNFSATQDFTNFIFATNGVIQGLAIGTYNVLVADDNGCTKTVFATIPNATADNFLTSTDSTSCYGSDYNDGGAHIIPVSYLNSPFQYGIDGGISQLSGDFYGLSAGAHVITATNINGCISEIPVLVLEPLPIVVDVVPDTVFLPLGLGQQVVVTYLNAAGEVTYSWTPELGLSCIDCPNPTVSPFTQQDYVITVSMMNGSATCYGRATLHANVTDPLPVYIPNSFTPNGDGNNDLFQLYGQSVKTVDLKIFNRWGELVYQTNNQFNGWDGTYKGALQTPQVFTYAVKVVFLDDKKLDRKGTVTLLR